MKRILLLTAVFIMMLGTNFSSAQTDADNFYKSDLVRKKETDTLQSLSDTLWEQSRNRVRTFTQLKWRSGVLSHSP